jgi:hypothetical protein
MRFRALFLVSVTSAVLALFGAGVALAVPGSAGTATVRSVGVVKAVSALTVDDAWAVGSTSTGSPLTEHWDGQGWSVVNVPAPRQGALAAVDVVSAGDVWAVGTVAGKTLILHGDGTHWVRVHGSDVGRSSTLTGIAAVSTDDIWAVGSSVDSGGRTSTLIEHWDGTSWSVVPSPNAGRSTHLWAVSAASADDVWAVGDRVNHFGLIRSMSVHWDGSAWTKVRSALKVHYGGSLLSVKASSATHAWAAGYGDFGHGAGPYLLVERWNGHKWHDAAAGNPGGQSLVTGIDTDVDGGAWAVGYDDQGVRKPFIESWTDHQWKFHSLDLTGFSLYGIDVLSPTSAFAVGGNGRNPLFEYWDGHDWTRQ